ncbi:hypothetical protein OROGR_002627 [Orobanche gracilis]
MLCPINKLVDESGNSPVHVDESDDSDNSPVHEDELDGSDISQLYLADGISIPVCKSWNPKDFVINAKGHDHMILSFNGHGTTVIWIQLAFAIFIGVDSCATVKMRPNDPKNPRAYNVLVSTVDDKFVELIHGVYATFGGDKARCEEMRRFVENEMNNMRAKNLTPNLVAVCEAANVFFQFDRWVPPTNYFTRIMICGWNPSENRCNIFEVGDLLHSPQLRTEAFFGFGSGFLFAAPMLQEWNTEYATMDANKAANILKDILLNVTLRDPFTGGDLKDLFCCKGYTIIRV